MNNSNKSNQNNNYTSPDFENRYVRHPDAKHYSNSYRNEKYYYNNRSYYGNANWNSYSNFSRRAQSHNFHYRSREVYSQYDCNASHENKHLLENSRSFFNPFNDYVESSNSRSFEQNSEHVNSNDDERLKTPILRSPFESYISSPENPFKEYYSEDAFSSSKLSKEELGTEASVSNTNKSPDSSKDDTSVSKKCLSVNISKSGRKNGRFRSRSLSSSESDKKGKDKTDQTESEESEEQRIQEWTNTLLETNHNQITRLINPSNHKEKAAVNQLITKFSKSKRKEIFNKTLGTNSSELTDNDDRDINNENVSAELESVNTDDDEILIISDSKIKNSNLDLSVTNLCTLDISKASSSKYSNINCDINSENIRESSKSPVDQNSNMCSKDHENIEDDFISNESSPNNSSSSRYKEKYVKRKSVGNHEKVKKKQKTTSSKSLNAFNIDESEDLSKGEATPVNGLCPPGSSKTTNQDSSVSDIKEEVVNTVGEIAGDLSNSTSNGNKCGQNLVFNPDVSVDTLIQLFATGNVKVKEEFNDPVMDALKEISSDELINACTDNSLNACEETTNKATTSSVKRKNSKDKSPSKTSMNTVNKNCINPVILGSAAIDDSVSSSVTAKTNHVGTNAVNENMCSSSVAHIINPVLSKSSVSANSLSESDELNKTKAELPPYLNKLIKQLQDVTSEEEMVKENLIKAKFKINEYTSILEEWKGKKEKLHEQEEDLRKKRNSIIKLLQDAVETDDDDNKKESTSSLKKKLALVDKFTSKKKVRDENSVEMVDSSETFLATSSSSSPKQQKQKEKGSSECDEITILPPPQKPQPPEIIICDDEESIPFDNQANDSRRKIGSNVSSNKTYKLKNVIAHATVVNCLVVFEDFLYTCSNDNTAKRFNLKDGSLSVTYFHTAKNVTEVVVEKVQNEALVFTSCSVKLISLFIASSGTKIKSFFLPCQVMSICKGWGKFYSGLANGAVNVYNWKYEEHEVVKTEQPAHRIATAHQGRLHVLVILSTEGNISIRDAETGLLIRFLKIYIKHPSWMCLHNDFVYLSSSDKILIILDIMNGKVEQRLHMANYTTGLAVCDDHIFTVSYNGLINCYSRDKMCDKKLFYGAGKSGLTCLHVHHNWVFTGNRKGDVEMFYFDPNSSVSCEIDKCDFVYGLKEDLEYHVMKDHLLRKKKATQCYWRGCNFTFPKFADHNDKFNHLKTHIYPMKLP